MAFRIPFSLVLAAPFVVAAATKPVTTPMDERPIQYKAFPTAPATRAMAAACTDCGAVTEIEHQYGEDAGVLVHVRMDDGRELVVRRPSAEDVAVGTRVHLNEGRVRRY